MASRGICPSTRMAGLPPSPAAVCFAAVAHSPSVFCLKTFGLVPIFVGVFFYRYIFFPPAVFSPIHTISRVGVLVPKHCAELLLKESSGAEGGYRVALQCGGGQHIHAGPF